MRKHFTCIIIFIACSLPGVSPAQVLSVLSQKYTPVLKIGTIKEHLVAIENSGISISYSNATVETDKIVALGKEVYTIEEVLNMLLEGQNVDIVEKKNKVLIVPVNDKKNITLNRDVYTVNGFIKESGSDEVLVSAVVYAPGTEYGTTTNNFGYYSLTIPTDIERLVYSYIGYKADTVSISSVNERVDVILKKQNTLDEVKVYTAYESSTQHVHVNREEITSCPALLGEQDVMRALQNEAGVQAGIDGSTSILVRGGTPGQNLNLLDGVPLYYVDHFFGLTSIYNSEAIKSVDFYKGAFPSRYGGRLSSVIDVTTRDGNMEKWGGHFNMGLVKGGLSLEGPIVKNKSSIIVSARRTWLDALWKPFTKNPSVNFYDINAKANYIINDNNRVYLSYYNGRDKIKSNVDDGDISTQWGNHVASAKWNSVINSRMFLTAMLTYSKFRFQLRDTRQIIEYGGISNANNYTGTSTINELSNKLQANWNLSAKHNVEFGIKLSYAAFTPVSVESNDINNQSLNIPISSSFTMNEVTLYAEDNIQVTDRLLLRPGIHWATWFNNDFNYSALQPRFYAEYEIKPDHKLHASLSQMAQYLHLLSNNTYGLPTDFWVPSTRLIEPEESIMGTLGYQGTPGKNFKYNVDLYYKDVEGMVMYNIGKNIFDNNIYWEDKIIQGKGWSYGAEISLEKRLGPFTTAMAYTLSWTNRKFSQLNDGKPFPYRYDRRHNFKTSLVFQKKRFEAAASWLYMSGEAITLPDQLYPDFDRNLMIDPGTSYYSNYYTYNIADWNNYRLPPIHRLDVGLKFIKYRKKSVRTWSMGVFNAYARPNVLYAELIEEVEGGGFDLRALNLLQVIPYINYKLVF